jgi:hypothetical protein
MWLNHVQLNLSLSQYFDLFGVNISPVVHILATASRGALLQNTPGLKHLELCFSNPYESESPWYGFYDSFGSRTWFLLDPKYLGMEKHPCQKTTVDWVLTFAFSFIKDISKVHLSGSIKNSTKKKWYYILEREYRERKYDFRTHGYGRAAELDVILHTPVYA